MAAVTDPVQGWNESCLISNESAFGTPTDPAAAQGFEVINSDLGPSEAKDRRPKKDKTLGRDMTLGFVSGRQLPIPFAIEASVKSRSAADTVPKESAILKAAGFTQTVNGATSVAYSMSSTPTITGLSVYRTFGTTVETTLGEWGVGGLVNQLVFSGGDTELLMKAGGNFIRKHFLGYAASVTLVDAADTTAALGTATDGYRFGEYGFYQTESEIVKVTANDYAGVLTVSRAQLSSSAAAHSATALYPYMPTPTLAGSPISEANCTVTVDSVAMRCTKFSITVDTGISHLPGETGSAYIQGGKATRLNATVDLELVLTRQFVDLIGKASQFKPVACTIVCGTGTGGIVTFSLPTCEIVAFPTPGPANDITIVSMKLRVRGGSGNDSFTYTAT